MRVFSVSALVLAVGVVAAADDKKADPAADLKAMVGKWEVVKAELGGKDVTEHLKMLDFEVREGGKYTAKMGAVVDEGVFSIDPSKDPREMDIKTGKDGPSKGATVKAIYKISSDEFTVCYQFGGGGDRPKKFETKPDTMLYLATYKRKK